MSNNKRSKLIKNSEVKRESIMSTQTERVEMTLNTDSRAASGLLIQRLTELYEKPVEASVRETISNAMDAVIEKCSGKRSTVEVFTPTKLSPVFKVVDNGIGMTYNDLKNVYSKYGSSTKADDLNQIGAYGLGAKSPLAYGTSFTVTSVKDNEKTTIIVAQEEMANYIKIVETIETDEPAGTTISIPVEYNDIDEFSQTAKKYLDYPLDKDIDLFIDGELVENNDFALLTNNLLILNGSEKVKTNAWVKKDLIADLLLGTQTDDILDRIKLVIGGWAYDNPEYASSYYNRNKTCSLAIELKAGVVGFNSSRDKITKNRRSEKAISLIRNYLKSEEYVNDVVKLINKLELQRFKTVLAEMSTSASSYSNNSLDPFSKNPEERIINVKRRHNYRESSDLKLDFNRFKHEETGFTIESIVKDIPKKEKPTFLWVEEVQRYSKAVMNRYAADRENYPVYLVKDNISAINEKMEKAMFGKEMEHANINDLIAGLFVMAHQERGEKNSSFTIITDLKDSDIPTIKTKRKSIMKLRTTANSAYSYSTALVYSKYTKSEMTKAVKSISESEIDIQVKTFDEIMEDLKKNPQVVKTSKSSYVIDKTLSTKVNKFAETNDSRGEGLIYWNYDDIDKKEKNVFLLISGSLFHSTQTDAARKARNWYCNKNKVSPKDINFYVSKGTHRVIDVKLLEELGELFYFDDLSELGRSKYLKETLKNKAAGQDPFIKGSVTQNQILARFIVDCTCSSLENSAIMLKGIFEDSKKKAKLLDVELPEIPNDFLSWLKNYDSSKLLNQTRYGGWRLTYTEQLDHLKIMGKETKTIVNQIKMASLGHTYEVEAEEVEGYSHIEIKRPLKPETVEALLKDKNKANPLIRELAITSEKAKLKVIKDLMERLLKLEL